MELTKFSPTVAELQALVDKTRGLAFAETKEGLKAVKEARIKLKDARVNITKVGKELRQEALDFQREVIATEKQLVAIIEPEENRLAAIEAAVLAKNEREERREFIPRRRERLNAIGDGVAVTDDELLDMDGTAFEGYFNARTAKQNEKARLENETKEKALKEEADRMQREKDIAAVEERGRKEAEEREKQRKAKEVEDAARAERERIAEEARKKMVLDRNRRYRETLESVGYNDKDFMTTTEKNGIIHVWKRVALFSDGMC